MMRKYNSRISEKANESLNKREAVVRAQKTALVLLLTAFVFAGLLWQTSVSAKAGANPDTDTYQKYYTSIQIKSGDTLWAIADEYIAGINIDKMAYIDEVCELNRIHPDDIHAGKYLIVPYYSEK